MTRILWATDEITKKATDKIAPVLYGFSVAISILKGNTQRQGIRVRMLAADGVAADGVAADGLATDGLIVNGNR